MVNVDILFTGKCKTKLSMCYSLQTSADGSRLPRPGRAYGPAASWLTVTVEVGRDMRVGPTYLTYLSTFENFPGVESARQLVSDILPIVRGRYK